MQQEELNPFAVRRFCETHKVTKKIKFKGAVIGIKAVNPFDRLLKNHHISAVEYSCIIRYQTDVELVNKPNHARPSFGEGERGKFDQEDSKTSQLKALKRVSELRELVAGDVMRFETYRKKNGKRPLAFNLCHALHYIFERQYSANFIKKHFRIHEREQLSKIKAILSYILRVYN